MRKGVSSPVVRGHAARVPDLEFPHPLILVTFLATTDHYVVRTRRGRCYRWGKPFASVPDSTSHSYSQFADGHSYSKNKMDEILRSGALDKLPHRQKENHPHVKREDVELIVGRGLEGVDGTRD